MDDNGVGEKKESQTGSTDHRERSTAQEKQHVKPTVLQKDVSTVFICVHLKAGILLTLMLIFFDIKLCSWVTRNCHRVNQGLLYILHNLIKRKEEKRTKVGTEWFLSCCSLSNTAGAEWGWKSAWALRSSVTTRAHVHTCTCSSVNEQLTSLYCVFLELVKRLNINVETEQESGCIANVVKYLLIRSSSPSF